MSTLDAVVTPETIHSCLTFASTAPPVRAHRAGEAQAPKSGIDHDVIDGITESTEMFKYFELRRDLPYKPGGVGERIVREMSISVSRPCR